MVKRLARALVSSRGSKPAPEVHNTAEPVAGIIIKVNPSGFAFVSRTQSKRTYVFTFDKIRNYRGQTADQLGLRTGKPVRMFLDGKLVRSVELAAEVPPSALAAAAASGR